MMRICVNAIACVAFAIKHSLLQNFVSTPTQTLLEFCTQWMQDKEMLCNVGGGVKLGCGPI
jgi:hypothetical protein